MRTNKTLGSFLIFVALLSLYCGKGGGSGTSSSENTGSGATTVADSIVLSVDTTFANTSGADGEILAIRILSDNKIMIGGDFTQYNGTARKSIARLNADGSLDTSFDPGTGVIGSVKVIEIQSDGKLIIGGLFNDYNGTSRTGIARLESNGLLDTSFDSGPQATRLNDLKIQSDGKIIYGNYTTGQSATIKRFNSDGTLDSSFNFGGVFNFSGDGIISALTLGSGGRIIMVGDFDRVNSVSRTRLASINADGTNDDSFATEISSGTLKSVMLLANGKFMIGGSIGSYGATNCQNIARINSDGSLDSSFDTANGPNDVVYTIVEVSNNKVLIGGEFTQYNTTAKNYFARVSNNGTLDAGFDFGTGPNQSVRVIKVQLDGNIVLGGSFTQFNGVARGRIVRLKP